MQLPLIELKRMLNAIGRRIKQINQRDLHSLIYMTNKLRSSSLPGNFTPLFAAGFLILMATASSMNADDIFNSDFSKGTIDALGWKAKGDWSILDYGDKKPGLANNPGPVAVFAAKGKTAGTLTKTFPPIANPSSLTLTFDGGFGWGNKAHVQAFDIMLLDADGNGYVFDVHRANATWGAQWANVSKYGYNTPMTWAAGKIDTTQDAVVNGGGLRTFTITRDSSGKFTFNGAGWTGGPLSFTDTTVTTFSQVVIQGTPNSDELAFNKIKLEATK